MRYSNSQYLKFVSNKDLKSPDYYEDDILVYTKKTKRELFVGFIRKSPLFPEERKFQVNDGIVMGKHCLLALSRLMNELDKEEAK